MKQVKNPVAFESNFAIHNLFTIQDGSIVVDGGVIFTIYELTEKIWWRGRVGGSCLSEICHSNTFISRSRSNASYPNI